MVAVISMLAIYGVPRTSSSAYTVSSSILANTVAYNLVDILSPTPSYITVNDVVLALHGGSLPQTINLGLTYSYNGSSVTTVTGCTINTHGLSLTSCSFKVPWKGWGDYMLIGSVYGSNGTLLAATGIDPHIEPEWK